MTPVFAHLEGMDHWWSSLLYLVPVLIVGAGIAFTSWRDRRLDEDDAPADDDGPTTREPRAAP